MGRPRSGRLPNKPLVYMTERHREMARQLVTGERQCDVARTFGISQARMSDICRSPVFMEYVDYLARMREAGAVDIASSVRHGSSAGIELLTRVLTQGTPEYEGTDLRTKVSVARDLLDREGSAPRTTAKQATKKEVSPHVTAEDIAELKAMRKARQKALISTETD